MPCFHLHSFGVGDIKEVWTLGLKFGVRGHHEVDALHLDQTPFFQQQVLHHLMQNWMQ